MQFIIIKVNCSPELSDILITKFFEVGFDSFQEFDEGFEGSCEEVSYNEDKVSTIMRQFPNITYRVKEQEKVNWNKEWEKNYDPIIVDNKCIVRASFHSSQPQFEYEIIVNPKISFGIGHHAATYQVLSYQMDLDHQEKKVLDIGTGTGILTQKRGASTLTATDIDAWCIENSEENFALNKAKDVSLIQGQIEAVRESGFLT